MDAKALLRDTLEILTREIGSLDTQSKVTPLPDEDASKLCSYIKVLAVLSNAQLDEDGDKRVLSQKELNEAIREAISAIS